MRISACVLAIIAFLSVAAFAAEPENVSLKVSNTSLSAAADQLAKNAGVSIVVDPSIDTKVTISIGNLELAKVLDVMTDMTKTTWKKVQFAKLSDSKVSIEQIKLTVLTLATMPLLAASVQDGTGKGAAMFARNMPGTPDTSKITLPEGYSWVTVYAIYSPTQAVAKSESAEAKKAIPDQITKDAFLKPGLLANMTPAERQIALQNEMMGYMTLAPNVRRQVLRDQMDAIKNLDPRYRNELMSDMRNAMRGIMGGRRRNN